MDNEFANESERWDSRELGASERHVRISTSDELELKPCPFCGSPVKWCGENELNPEDNHLCHHIQCTNSECAADFDFNTANVELLPDDTDNMTTEDLLTPFRIECAKRFNNREARANLEKRDG